MVYLWIGLFSIAGALLRYLISLYLQTYFYTLFVNISGAFLLGFCTAYFKRTNIHPHIKTGITTGFLGSFTTFSVFSKEVVMLFNNEQYMLTYLYLLTSMSTGLFAAFLGLKRGEKI